MTQNQQQGTEIQGQGVELNLLLETYMEDNTKLNQEHVYYRSLVKKLEKQLAEANAKVEKYEAEKAAAKAEAAKAEEEAKAPKETEETEKEG